MIYLYRSLTNYGIHDFLNDTLSKTFFFSSVLCLIMIHVACFMQKVAHTYGNWGYHQKSYILRRGVLFSSLKHSIFRGLYMTEGE